MFECLVQKYFRSVPYVPLFDTVVFAHYVLIQIFIFLSIFLSVPKDNAFSLILTLDGKTPSSKEILSESFPMKYCNYVGLCNTVSIVLYL